MLLIFFLSAKYHNKLFYSKNKLFICLEMPQVKFKRMHSIFFHSEDDLDLDDEVLIADHSTVRAIQAVRITVRPARVLVCILDKIYSI